MPLPPKPPQVLRFATFEVSPREGELRKNGLRIKLQDQPFQVLVMLLERPGEMVTREELQRRLWPADTFVDFDHSLNSAVKKLREALGDQAENPRFIETLHRRGYRFVAPVEGQLDASGPQADGESVRHAVPRWVMIAGAVAALLAVAGIVAWLVSTPSAPRVLNYTQLTKDGADKINVVSIGSIPPPIVTDGSRLYFSELQRGASGVIGHLTYAQNSTFWGLSAELWPPSFLARSGSGRRLRIFRSKLQCCAGCCRCKCLFLLGWSCIGFYAESQPESGVASTGKKPAGPFVISRSRFIKR